MCPLTECDGQGTSFKTKNESEVLEVFIERGSPDGHKVHFYNKADELSTASTAGGSLDIPLRM